MDEYFEKAERKELEVLPERMEAERDSWLNLVDFPTWQIFEDTKLREPARQGDA